MAGRWPSIILDGGRRLYSAHTFSSFRTLCDQWSGQDDFAVFRRFLGPGAVFFDVGANLGVTSIVAARIANSIRIVAFEPTAECAEVWRKNIAANGVADAVLFECALAEKSGTTEFIAHKAANYNRLNIGNTISRHSIARSPDTILKKIPVKTVDQVCAELNIQRISLLKIDVEGAEPAVLRGARKMLKEKAIDAVFVEFVPEYMLDMNEDVTAFVEMMSSYGYMAFEIGRGGIADSRIAVQRLTTGEFDGPNLIFRQEA